MIALNDAQLKTVMAGAAHLPHEKRDLYLQRVGAMLALRGRFNDGDVDEVVRLALRGLAQEPIAVSPNCVHRCVHGGFSGRGSRGRNTS